MSDGSPQVMTREEQRRRAHELMNDPLLLQAFYEITESATHTWKTTTDIVQREQQWYLIQAVKKLEQQLLRVLEDEKVLGRREQLLRGG
jgi:hypothetical protein